LKSFMKKLLTQTQINLGVKGLSRRVEEEIKQSGNNLPPVFICVLRGGFMFFNDLVRNLPMDIEIDFIQAQSYNGRDNSDGVTITKDIKTDLKGKQVYVVDDLVDTGATMKEILFYLEDYRPASIKILTAFHRRMSKIWVDDFACQVDDEWLVGYGLDDNGLKRNLEGLYAL